MGTVSEICKKGLVEGAAPHSVILPYDQLITLVRYACAVELSNFLVRLLGFTQNEDSLTF